MSGNQFVIEEACTFKGISYTCIKGHLGDDQDTTYIIMQEVVSGELVDRVSKKENNEKGEPEFLRLKGEEIAEFFRNIEHKGISVSENYTKNKSAEGYLEPEFAVSAFDSIRLMCNKPKKTFVIEESQSLGKGIDSQFIGHFEGGVDNAKYLIKLVKTEDGSLITTHKGDEEQLGDFDPPESTKLSGFATSIEVFASMDVIKASDDYNNNKTGVSLPLDDAVRFLSTLRDMVKGKFK